ncbi:MAG: acylneuraminate cytidylyltransferase family protein [Methanobacteriota archaeon]
MEILALIPARGGSKRVPKKNIRLLGGKPLISYTIEAAKKSKHINRIIVSTENEEIAEVSRKYGAEVPFIRPKEISGDESCEIEFFDHTLNWLLENEDYEPDLIVELYPTSPFRTAELIDEAIVKLLKHPEADSLRSVRLCREHPYKMWLECGGFIEPFVFQEDSNVHTFSHCLLPKVFIQNASINITKPSTIRNKKSPVGDVVVSFIMDETPCLDINNEIDFEFAEFIIRRGIRNVI